MVDITHKENTFRTAIAEALVVVGSPDTIRAIEEGRVPKGDVLVTSPLLEVGEYCPLVSP